MTLDTPATPAPHARGRHKIFLGYAPGVGKTYTMLAEAHRRVSRGEDVAIGIVETHGRAETAKLTEGLEQVPRKQLHYRGSTFEEMDTAAVIARHPTWALVDELAHTNIPGTRHAKRWQSVEEILDAGISVISTVNVQHFESLNDTVQEITGFRVRETLPDSILDGADEVEVVDLTPSALLNRLRRGDIYALAKVPAALTNFFRAGNLGALRELALRRTADEVDEQLRDYMAAQHIAGTWKTQERVAVCVTPRPYAAKLVRRGYTVARRMGGLLWTVHVRTPGQALPQQQEALLNELAEMTRNFGGTYIELENESVADALVRFADENQATFIVMGQSVRSRLDEILHGSLINRILRKTRTIDVLVVSSEEPEEVRPAVPATAPAPGDAGAKRLPAEK
jgi:two-component system, OmpR family, sensor histidine kinase KdpD